MAFGVVSNSALLFMGVPPAQASAIVHTAEIFTTAGSAGSHLYHRNVDWRLVLRLGSARFGSPGQEIVDALERIADVEDLERLAEGIFTATSWQDLLALPPAS